MIQLSALPTTSPENQAKTPVVATLGVAFAGLLTEKMDGGIAANGNNLPESGKILPETGNGLPAAARDIADQSAKMVSAVRIVPAGETLGPQILIKKVAIEKAETAENASDSAPAAQSNETKLATKPGKLAEALKALQRQLNAPGKADTEDRLGEDVPDAVAPALEHLESSLPLQLAALVVPAPMATPTPVLADGKIEDSQPSSQGSRREGVETQQPLRTASAALLLQPSADKKAADAAISQTAANQATAPQAGAQEAPRVQLAREFQVEQFKDAKPANSGDAVSARADRSAEAKPLSLPLDAAPLAPSDTGSSSQRGHVSNGSAPQPQTVRPQDFNTLVDRLVEARENARAGSANVSVIHSDFGEVSLRFSHDNGNLTVSMASRDPEFARAVNAAMPADGSQTGEAPFQREGRNDGAAAFSARAETNANNGSQANASRRDDGEGWDVETDAETLSAEPRRSALGGIYA